MSSRDLTTNEIKLLKKGLKFTPTQETNKNELRNDIQEFGRKLRLIEYYDSHQNETDQSIVRNKSNFFPAKTNDKHLELFLDSLSKYQDQISAPQHVKSNLSKDERTALQQLMDDNNIIIKEADKSGATVIMDKIFYKDNIEELLSDTENYTIINGGNQDESIMKRSRNFYKNLKKTRPKRKKNIFTNFPGKRRISMDCLRYTNLSVSMRL